MTSATRVAVAAIDAARNPCITCSFQVEGMVLLHILRARRPDIPVLFLDTAHHFEETYAYRDEMTKAWRLNLVILRADEPSPGLWQTSTEACCARHKVGPLFSALETYDTWFTGLRREQSPSRANLEEVETFALPSGAIIGKVNPLAVHVAAARFLEPAIRTLAGTEARVRHPRAADQFRRALTRASPLTPARGC